MRPLNDIKADLADLQLRQEALVTELSAAERAERAHHLQNRAEELQHLVEKNRANVVHPFPTIQIVVKLSELMTDLAEELSRHESTMNDHQLVWFKHQPAND